MVTEQGDVLREIALGHDSDAGSWHACWLNDNRFLLTLSAYGIEKKAKAWWLDTEQQTLVELTKFDCPSVECLARLPDGGFTALATARYRYTMTSGLHAFDADGATRWSIAENSSDDQNDLFSPEAIAVNEAGEIVVLDVIRHTLQFFSQQGTFLRRIDLETVWGREPNYPSGLAAVHSGLIIRDFGAKKPFVRVDGTGAQQSAFAPRLTDGRLVDCVDFETTSDDRVWVTDRHSLMRLDKNGVVDHVVGASLQTRKLNDIATLEIDSNGTLYAVDRRTATTHVFDSTLKPSHRCELEPSDFSGELFSPSLAVDDSGETQLCVSDMANPSRFVRFSSQGERLGIFELEARTWQRQPGSDVGMLVLYDHIEMLNAKRETTRSIHRRPDGIWLEHPKSVRFDDEGRFAVLAENESRNEYSISVFDADATPLHVIVLPPTLSQFPSIDFRSDRIAVTVNEKLVVFDWKGQPIEQCVLVHDKTKSPLPRFMPGGKEVAISFGSGTEIQRFQMR